MSSTLDYVKAQLPEFADTYVRDMLSRTQALTDINENPYRQYEGPRVAEFSDLQNQAFEGAGNLGPSQYTRDAAGIASLAAQRALGTNYQPGQFTNQYQSQGPYRSQTAQNRFQAPRAYTGQGFQNQFRAPAAYDASKDVYGNQFRAPREYQSANIRSDKFGQPQAREYMSPYIQNVINMQQRDAQRQADIARTERNAQFTGKGAFGGSRQAIMDAEAARNLALQKGDITAKGMQDAYTNAQAQFNADQGRGLTAQQATEQSRQFGSGQGLQAANLGAQYGTAAADAAARARQFAATTNLQAANLGAQYGTAAEQARMLDRQFGAGQGMTAAQLAAQYGLGADTLSQGDRQFGYSQGLTDAANRANYGQQAVQLGEQSRQYGAGLGLQGLTAANTAAGTLGTLGNNFYNQSKDAIGTQYALGSGMQARDQALMDVDYGNWQAANNYPREMLQFQSGMLNSLPMNGYGGSVTQQDAPNYGSQILGGLLTWGAGLGKAKGGVIDGRRSGLLALAASKYL